MVAQQGQDDSRAVAPVLTIHSRAARASRLARSVLAVAAVAATSLAAVTTALGGAAASAATVHPARAVAHTARAHPVTVTGMTWHPLSLLNGWQSAQGQYGTGNPAWAVRNGIVYLSGSMHQASGNSEDFAVLPAAARPAHYLYITVYTLDDTYGRVAIYPDGEMNVFSPNQSQAQGYTSLAAISFPAAAIASTNLTLKNGWQSSQSQWGTGDPGWTVKNGVVNLSGSMHQPSGTSRVAAVLPPAARPAHYLAFIVYTYGGATGEVDIETDGTVLAFSPTAHGSAQQFTSLAGISYPLGTAGDHALGLLNGWFTDGILSGDPSYSVAGGVVYLSGGMHQPLADSNAEFAVLPPTARPAHNLFIKLFTNGSAGELEITSSGQMLAYSSPDPTNVQQYTDLAGISYPLSS
jgi:hypothetical protein